MTTVTVEIAPGELIDKITILKIKTRRITDPDKLANVQLELRTLSEIRGRALRISHRLNDLTAELQTVNERLWEIEDAIRECERAKDFGEDFIQLARAVYQTNDRRAALKREINLMFGSAFMEEKSYKPY